MIEWSAVCSQALASGKSVVVDNTNPASATRAEYLELVKDRGEPARLVLLVTAHTHCVMGSCVLLGCLTATGCNARCFQFMAKEELAKHLNMYREVRSCRSRLVD